MVLSTLVFSGVEFGISNGMEEDLSSVLQDSKSRGP